MYILNEKCSSFCQKTMGLQSAYNNETDIKGNSQKFSNSTILCWVPPLSAAGQPGVYWRGVCGVSTCLVIQVSSKRGM